MPQKQAKKVDRRTLYTVNTIKDALLELLERTTFDKISVASVCRQAEITRTTFYLHFPNLTAVLNEVLHDAMQVSENALLPEELACGLPHAEERGQAAEKMQEPCDALLPMCQRIADSAKYRAVFLDETLSGYIIKIIYQHEKDKVIPSLMQRGGLSRSDAEMLFRFMLYGSFAVNKELGWEKNEKWYAFQTLLLRFTREGMGQLRTREQV